MEAKRWATSTASMWDLALLYERGVVKRRLSMVSRLCCRTAGISVILVRSSCRLQFDGVEICDEGDEDAQMYHDEAHRRL